MMLDPTRGLGEEPGPRPQRTRATVSIPHHSPAAASFLTRDRLRHHIEIPVSHGAPPARFVAETDILCATPDQWAGRPERTDPAWTVIRSHPVVIAYRTTPPPAE